MICRVMYGNGEDWYEAAYPDDLEEDPVGPATGSDRVIRGGSWYDLARCARSANREGRAPGHTEDKLGFRLVLSSNQ